MKTLRVPFTKGARALLWSPREGVQFMTQELRAEILKANGEVVDKGIVSRKLITTEGVNHIRDSIKGVAGKALCFGTFAIGGSASTPSAENIADTAAGSLANIITGLDASANSLYYVTVGDYTTSFVIPAITTGTKTLILVSTFDFVGITGIGSTPIKELFFCCAGGGSYGVFTLDALLDRSVLTGVAVTVADKLRFTFTLTFSDGG